MTPSWRSVAANLGGRAPRLVLAAPDEASRSFSRSPKSYAQNENENEPRRALRCDRPPWPRGAKSIESSTELAGERDFVVRRAVAHSGAPPLNLEDCGKES